ncbi:MAG: SUMF1/EgtB/PvdO family nonheme iron enzyme [Halioglobus sp.]
MAYCFGEFTLDPRTGTLTGPDGVVPLRRQAFQLCEVLLENAPELMVRDQLMDQIWGRTVVSPNVLAQTISELRQALGDDPQAPRYIETKHRRGYRMVCEVSRAETQEPKSPERESQDRETSVPGPGPFPKSTPMMQQEPSRSLVRRYWVGALAAVVLVTGLWTVLRSDEQEILYRETLPDIRAAVDTDVFEAWSKTRQALLRHVDDSSLNQLMLDLTVPVSLNSQPSGATLMVGPYNAQESDWVAVGETPLEGIRLPLTMLRFRVHKPGYVGLDVAPSVLPFPEVFQLHTESATPAGMVFVPRGPVSYMGETRELPGFWIQRNEVSNREYHEFVEAGGYERSEYWQQPVERDGVELNREAVVSAFVDSTGLPGPSTWSLGTYPSDKGDHPVEGISWFEAAAYARFRGLELPTAFHWWRASGRGGNQYLNFADIVTASNYQGDGTWPVGQGGLGPHGTRDMAGNVGEWCLNSGGAGRHFLGGSWINSSYAYMDWYAQPGMNRGAGFGVRLIKTDEAITDELRAALEYIAPAPISPISDTTFAIFARQFNYDKTPLNTRIEKVDSSQRAWRRERISYDASYGDERITLQLFIPTAAEPPYQVVVHFPGGDAVLLDDSQEASLLSVEPFLRSGRVVAYPVYKGTYERKVRRQRGPMAVRNEIIEQTQDLRRTLDYLETRDDIALDKIAFHGLSYGGIRAPIMLAVEPRFTTAMILSAGLPPNSLPPEITLQHYLPRVTIPTLFIGGRDDFNQNYETAQVPFFELLGASDDQKKHVTFEGGHLPTGYSGLNREVIAWLDETLGKP